MADAREMIVNWRTGDKFARLYRLLTGSDYAPVLVPGVAAGTPALYRSAVAAAEPS